MNQSKKTISPTYYTPVNTLIVEFDAKHTSVDPDEHISCYVWKFGSSIFQTGSHVTHTLSVNKVTSTGTTVTNDSGTRHSKTVSTITFLKDRLVSFLSHINSLLLTKD